jgi:enoyl-CoA hydratase/carnithine racemase
MSENPDSEPLLITRNGPVMTVTLNKPRVMNALDLDMWRGLSDAVSTAAADPEVRVFVLTGAGSAFSTGADLGATRNTHPIHRMKVVSTAAADLHDLPKPTIARVPGPAVGGGWNLALCCDFVIASTNATFAQIFPKRGLSIDVGGSWHLPRLVGMQRAKLLTMLGDTISAAEAYEFGLVTSVVAPEELDSAVLALASRLALGPPVALALTKALLHEGTTHTLREMLESEARAQTVNFAGHDVAIGFDAFRKREPPEFTGGWTTRLSVASIEAKE